jgi:hypothetical protein
MLPNPALEAEELLGRAESRGTVVDLVKVVSLWPNLSVVEEDLEGAGYLLPIGEIGGTILVNRADKEERKRFTIAHELGHWVLGLAIKEATGRFSQPKNASYASIERWCDQFATNLLMPESAIRASVAQRDPVVVLESVASAAARFKVSQQAFYLRIWEVLRFQVAILALSGSAGSREAHVERGFGGDEANKALENALRKTEIVEQLFAVPIVHFSLSSPAGKIKCLGRRQGEGHLLLVLIWPTEGSTKSQAQETQVHVTREKVG